ncbi:SUMF1/EgtB/PvdO family nonheme iron enzyme [Tuwongella immobilis]|uniref:Protein kinase domain-containing protein n=1 Tax=Tuwongella immobilis TaxID=692036 RepID=A0A6C2YK90_9BACT|nr:SUMF1/EgtB/PvdO family nonheme iron enzyme [Tuwongella immobilis]VIP02000.1 cobalamin biosynthesis protein : Uncharacterized protein ybeQ OS=Capnocytophaga canimorsus (strain 5) GN=Ccan_12640 PE=4 SV=1: Pkinase: FGE-sulfatase: Sel1: Sel1: Sel1: Sel1: Sel1: Sel1: Sel1: Sel1: Sel1: Sel1 [Tuwongella immobilis]VTS00087.1 cobalamin biosynthesis protein : Uncharacterized protein ybeQ OS=Capnocytophaga canimorsus (strain 5) GN=Ccan_12640 PE=4 SV=1: Pkinase: FGE-sulfatase: Sel1: Sel1: Sel1: Sel1: Sel1
MSTVKERFFGLIRKCGGATKVVTNAVLSFVPGGAAMLPMVNAAIDSAQLIAQGDWEEQLLQLAKRNAGEAERLSRLLAALTTDLQPLCDAALDAVASGVRVESAVQELLSRDAALQGQVQQLGERIEAKLDATYAEVRDLHAKLDRLIDERNVSTSATAPLVVSVSNDAEREFLRQARERYRAQPAGVVSGEQWATLGDGLAAAGEFAAAVECQTLAANAPATTADERAEAHFKAYRAACELRRWEVALTELQAACALRPAEYRPFDLKRYEVLAILGAGGFGTVFHCRDRYKKDKRGQSLEYAIKTLHTADLDRDIESVFDEAHTLGVLEHPNIVRGLDQNFADSDRQQRPYLVLEYFAGPTLEAHLAGTGVLPLEDWLSVAEQIAAAVQAAHAEGVWHRDLKPGNVLVRREGSAWQVKVIDFGLAVKVPVARQVSQEVQAQASTTRAVSFTGTLEYAAPEQRGKLPGVKVGPYTDVFAFGKTCMWSLLGTLEPRGWHWKKLPEERRDGVQEFIERCAAEELSERLPNFDAVLTQLAALRGESKPTGPSAEELQREAAAQIETQRREREAAETRERERLEQARQEAERQRLQQEAEASERQKREAAEALERDRLEQARREAERQRLQQEAEASERQKRKQAKREATERVRGAAEAKQKAEKAANGLTIGDVWTNSVGMSFAYIPAGEFLMGSPVGVGKRGERPQHQVRISQPFWLGVTPVTRGQFAMFVSETGYRTAAETGKGGNGYIGDSWMMDASITWRSPWFTQTDEHPVVVVNYQDAQRFVQWLNTKGDAEYALPTEAQWEYACRAGTTTRYFFGDDEQRLGEFAWFDGNSGKQTHPVGEKAVNPWGLNDILGNVWEWCEDWFGPYISATATDPKGVSSGSNRVIRGGSWLNLAVRCRSSYRNSHSASRQGSNLGFRVAMQVRLDDAERLPRQTEELQTKAENQSSPGKLVSPWSEIESEFHDYLASSKAGNGTKGWLNRNVTRVPIWQQAAEEGCVPAMVLYGDCCDEGVGTPKHGEHAFRWYRKAAETGNSLAMSGIGWLYHRGHGVPQDYGEAMRWLRNAADASESLAMILIGWLYQNGQGVPQDYTEAMHWFRKAADAGNALAMRNIGVLHYNGQGLPQDYTEAMHWFRKAADAGNADAMNWMGWLYQKSEGVPQDYGEAMYWFRKAADAGVANAMNNIGMLFQYGQGVPQDYEEAMSWFRRAAEAGAAIAINNIGFLYQTGGGVLQDYSEAMRWFRKSADAGNALAMNNIGMLYNNGHGVPKDYGEAMRWFRKSADAGNALAMRNIGLMYRDGEGVRKDYCEAMGWYRRSADAGDASAMDYIGELYQFGLGVARDLKTAIEWYERAIAAGCNLAEESLVRARAELKKR